MFLGLSVDKAVITVPAYFTDAQKRATRTAGELAGLQVLRIIFEPTAAAIAHCLTNKYEKERKILIYDLGGGTFDVSILSICGANVTVIATGGDPHLGGLDFDENLLEYCLQEFQNQYNLQIPDVTEADKKRKRRKLRQIRVECENAKIKLSETTEAEIYVEDVTNDHHMEVEITRDIFNRVNEKFFNKTMATVQSVIQDADFRKEQIDDVILVGGSTRIPKIRELLTDYFKKQPIQSDIQPDELVARGAAIMAAIANGGKVLREIKFTDVAPYSLGILVKGGGFSIIVQRNSQIPIRNTLEYITTSDNQTEVCIDVFEGEFEAAEDNNLLGKFVLGGIPRNPAGKEAISVTIEVDNEGIVHVTAKCNSTGGREKLTISAEKAGLTKDEIEGLKKR